MQSLVARLKENVEKLMEERDQRSSSEIREKEQNKRLQRQIRDIKEEMGELSKKETEASRKKHELVTSLAATNETVFWNVSVITQFMQIHPPLSNVFISLIFTAETYFWLSLLKEMDIESLEAANQSLQADLKLAFKRIGDLQAAIEDEMESDDNEDLINRYRTQTVWGSVSGVILMSGWQLCQSFSFYSCIIYTPKGPLSGLMSYIKSDTLWDHFWTSEQTQKDRDLLPKILKLFFALTLKPRIRMSSQGESKWFKNKILKYVRALHGRYDLQKLNIKNIQY